MTLTDSFVKMESGVLLLAGIELGAGGNEVCEFGAAGVLFAGVLAVGVLATGVLAVGWFGSFDALFAAGEFEQADKNNASDTQGIIIFFFMFGLPLR